MRATPNEHLTGETSPYVLQHADNPVDWYPWGAEAFDRARRDDKPVFLSIGYAACHWCHVMAHESFEDQGTAAYLNERFVAIKVDREERPDVDAVYMDAVQAMTGSGGWPMSVFLTPEGEPFYAGTYFPDSPRHGMPSFRQVLEGIAGAWSDRRGDVAEQGSRVTAAIGAAQSSNEIDPLDPATIEGVTTRAMTVVRRSFDERWGGFGGAPKFPQASLLRWLLDRSARGDGDAATMLRRTLDAMADGGIHDQVGGGFARYSTDAAWHVPHFEKMLYDNAQLLGLYAHASVVFDDDPYRDVASRTADWMLSSLRGAQGGFSTSQDADSDGVEGAFSVWSWDELVELVGEPVAEAFGATPAGNWDGTNVLWRPVTVEAVAAQHGVDPARLASDVERGRSELASRRASRKAPAIDDKVIAAWNGLAISGLAIAGRALREPRFLEAAEGCAAFVWERLRDGDGKLLRSWRGGTGRIGAFADDHALVGLGFLALYERTGQVTWLLRARELGDLLLDRFVAPDGGVFQVGSDAEHLVVRKEDLLDEPTPSGTASAAELWVRLGHYTGDGRYDEHAGRALGRILPIAERAPSAAGQALRAAELFAGPIVEVAIVGADAGPLIDAVVADRYVPNAVVGPVDPRDPSAHEVPLFEGRLDVTEPTAFVCQRFACRLPVTSPEELAKELVAIA